MKKTGTLQRKPVVKRVIYLSRDAGEALNQLLASYFWYTPGEYLGLLILEEAKKTGHIKSSK